MSRTAAQLTLDLFAATRYEFDDFQAHGNAETCRALTTWSKGGGARVIYLWGSTGTGKTHLLHSAVREVSRHGGRAIYLPLAELVEAGPAVIDGLESVDWIALDDVDSCTANSAWENKLFHLYNALAAGETRLLWASRRSPASGLFGLNDLASRLSASLVYQLRELDDGDKADVLQRRAAARGLELPGTVVAFLMRYARRDLASLMATLDELDQASLRDGRALTVPFVRTVLDAGDEPAPTSG
jgi:DnaA-homolog protein